MSGLLIGTHVQLRRATANDVDARMALGNNPDIIEMFGVSRDDIGPISRDGAVRWVQRLIDQTHAWVIEAHGRLIGEIRLDNVDLNDRRASMAVGICDPNLVGKGLGSEAIRLVLHYAFVDLRLHRISIRVIAYNQRAIRAYQKCGFVIEGRERETAFVNGAWHDDVMMGILDREFLSLDH